MGEGFGLPIMEAQACGCPVVTTDFSAMTELTVNGIATQPAQLVWSPLNSWAAVPSVAAIEAALEEIYNWPTEVRNSHAERGILTMRERYDWDMCVRRYWLPFLARVESERSQWPSPMTTA
jgi:glycosyltransferase involved in cell wall biosynthesis